MNESSTPAKSAPCTVLNKKKLIELRRAHGFRTEAALAKAIGIDPSTLWRASQGYPVSGGVVASIKLAFPHVPLDDLFTAVPASVAARESVAS